MVDHSPFEVDRELTVNHNSFKAIRKSKFVRIPSTAVHKLVAIRIP